MLGLNGDHDTLGHVTVTYYYEHKYHIHNTFESIDSEKLFFFYLVDKVAADMDTHENAEAALAQIHNYLHDQSGAIDRIENEFSHLKEVETKYSEHDFTIKQELRSKRKSGVPNLYVNTSFNPKLTSDIYTRFVNAAMLYMMDLHDRASDTDLWRYGSRYSDMLRYYDDHGYPSTTTVTDAPRYVAYDSEINSVIEANT